MSDASPLRIGTLGAARIAPMALIRPAREVAGVEVRAVAARDAERARRFAGKHGIPSVHARYEDLLADPEIDAVYNPLPNGLHGEWTIRALEAGKHVLCEKPLASNADEAERMAEAAQKSGRVLAEAFHWRHHPLAARMLEVVRRELGEVRHLEGRLCIPLPFPKDIRYRLDLAGGATMDTGCYAINFVRHLAEAEPTVDWATAAESSPGVDRRMEAGLRFADGRTGRILCSLWGWPLLSLGIRAVGSEGELRVFNPIAPHFYHRLTIQRGGRRTTETVKGDATYTHQLRAFADWVRGGPPMVSDPADGIANMRVIDAVYEAAGLGRRGT